MPEKAQVARSGLSNRVGLCGQAFPGAASREHGFPCHPIGRDLDVDACPALVALEVSDPDLGDDMSTSLREETPYVSRFGVLLSGFGIPCNTPPWGTIAALDFDSRELAWESGLGTTRDLAPVPIPLPLGTPNMGGPIATAGGLVFVGAALDDYIRAYDSETGDLVWQHRLPAGGQATPMSYRVVDGGRQFVVIAAGGHTQMRSSPGDSVMAFALPE